MSKNQSQGKSFAAADILSTALTGGLAIAIVWIGTSVLTRDAGKAPANTHVDPTYVDARPVQLKSGFEVKSEFIGQIEPAQRTDIAFEISGKVEEIHVEEGERVKKGQVLASLDLKDLQNQIKVLKASLAALEAKADLARLTISRTNALKERGFTTQVAHDTARFELVELKARMAEVSARVAGVELKIEKASVEAPFDALVGARKADTGAIVGPSQAVLTLHQADATQMRVGVPPVLARSLSPGDEVEVEVHGHEFEGRVLSLRPDIDQRTHTRTVIIAIEEASTREGILYGQTGHVSFEREVPGTGFWVPVTALSEGVRGLWALNVVSRDEAFPIVRSEAVSVLHFNHDHAFVTGTVSDKDAVVISGQHRIVAGQEVRLAAK